MKTPVTLTLFSRKHPIPERLFQRWIEYTARSAHLASFLKRCCNSARIPHALDKTVETFRNPDGTRHIISDEAFEALNAESRMAKKTRFGVPDLRCLITFDVSAFLGNSPAAPELIKTFASSSEGRELLKPLIHEFDIGVHKKSELKIRTIPAVGRHPQ